MFLSRHGSNLNRQPETCSYHHAASAAVRRCLRRLTYRRSRSLANYRWIRLKLFKLEVISVPDCRARKKTLRVALIPINDWHILNEVFKVHALASTQPFGHQVRREREEMALLMVEPIGDQLPVPFV